MIIKSLTKISLLLSSPILTNLRIFIIFCILFFAPDIIYRMIVIPQYVFAIFHLLYSVAYSITYSYILCILLILFKEPIKNYIGAILVFVLWLITTLELYVIFFVRTRFTPFIVQLVMETNSRESSEFISTYITKTPVIVFFTILISILIFFLLILKKSKHAIKTNYRLFKTLINAVIIGSLLLAIFSSLQTMKKLEKVTAVDTLIYSILQNIDTFEDVEKLKLSSSKINPIQSKQADTIENIVVIVGESFSKHHSNLYDYYLITNPNLKKLKDNENLFVYSDVVAPWNLTSEVFKLVLSFKSQDDDLYWADTPLFPAIFKKSGWGSFFISNQIVKKKGTQWDFQMRSYLNDSEVEHQQFTGRNDKLHEFDIELLEDYESLSHKLLKHNLIIFHLMGQHVKYTERYPPTFNYFSSDSIKRNDLKLSHKQEIAEYDNSTRYNDYVVSEIINKFKDKDAIAIYFSDHGEEANDYRIQMDRTMEAIISRNMARYQFEIPFMIWTSDTFKEKHPDLTHKIKNAVNRPYMIDDVPHLLIDLSGIQCKWFDPTRSVINDKLNVNRKRFLRNGEDYDEIMMLPKILN